MSKATSAFILAALAMANTLKMQVISIPSAPITLPGQSTTWSRCDMQRMKGKAARKNRGKNRRRYAHDH